MSRLCVMLYLLDKNLHYLFYLNIVFNLGIDSLKQILREKVDLDLKRIHIFVGRDE